MVTAAGLLVGGVVLAVAPPSWVQATLGAAPAVSGPDWAAHTQTQLTSVDQQLSVIAQTRRNWQAVPAPLRAQPPVALTRLEQRATALEKDRETLARALAAYRKTSRVDIAAAQGGAVTDTAPEQTTSAVAEVNRFIAQAGPSRQGPVVPAPTEAGRSAGAPDLPSTSIAVIPAPPAPAISSGATASPAPTAAPTPTPRFGPAPAPPAPPVVRPHNTPRTESAPAGATPATPRITTSPPVPARRPGAVGGSGVAPAHTAEHGPTPQAHPSGRSGAPQPAVRPSSGSSTTPAPGQGPYVVYLPPEPSQPQQAPPAQSEATRPPVYQQQAPAALPPSRSQTRTGSEDRAPFSESEVEKYTGDRDIARESQTPEGRAILREMFGGG
jgi:hypothetical protein